MKNYLRCLWLGVLALTVGLTACSDDDPEPAPSSETPEIYISDVKATATTVEFFLTPIHAVRYTYTVALEGEAGDLVEVKSEQGSKQRAEGLTADREYVITAVAYAVDGTKSEEATHRFTTTSLATVSIGKNIVVTFCTATVSITPTNALSVSYAWYPSKDKPAELDWHKVEDVKGTFPAQLEGLLPETEYMLEAYASNADGNGPVATSAAFTTEAAPTVEIGDVIASTKTAIVQFTPVNATGLKYACYLAGERPAQPEWTDYPLDKTTTKVEATISNLTPKTDYVLEAVGYTAAGEGEPVTREFRTAELPMLEVKTVVTANAVWARFEVNMEKTSGYYYSSVIDPTNEWADYKTVDGFLKDLDENDWAYTLKTEPYELVSQAMSSTKYKLFAVCTDAEGKVDPSTVQEFDLTTNAMDYTGQGSATVEFASVQPGSITTDANFDFSENCIMYIAGMLTKSEAETAGGIQVYINMNLDALYPKSAAMLTNPQTFDALSPETDYYLYAIAIDDEGKYGQIVSQEVRTQPVSYDPNARVDVSVYEQGFVSMIFDVKMTGVSTVRYRSVSKADFALYYENNDESIFTELFNEMADQMFLDEDGRFQLNWLTYNTDYYLFVLPVKDDGSFGTRDKIEFSTGRFEATGTASVTFDNVVENPQGGGTMTITPSDDCARFVYVELGDEVFDIYQNNLGEYVMSLGFFTGDINPAVATDIEVILWGEGTHLVAIACDKDGHWSEPVSHYFALPAPTE